MPQHIYDFKYGKYGNTEAIIALQKGPILQTSNYTNKGIAYTEEERNRLDLVGHLPPTPRPLAMQVLNSADKVSSKNDDIERFIKESKAS